MANSTEFSRASAPDISLLSIGAEETPLLIADGAFADPCRILRYAESTPFRRVEGAGNHFPGVRADLPESFAAAALSLLAPHLARFSLSGRDIPAVTLNCLQMVTTPPEDLVLPQRLPHFDTYDPSQIACLLFLSPSDMGGTDFYRHRASRFERIGPERFHPYTQGLIAEVRAGGRPTGYFDGTDRRFEIIHSVEARFNRLIAYPSNLLHSGRIPTDASLSDDPRRGRLMASLFLRFPPAASDDRR